MDIIADKVDCLEAGSARSQRIRLSGQRLPKKDVELLREILSTRESIKSLDLERCLIDESDLIYLFQHMRNFNLMSLRLSNVRLKDDGAVCLATAMQESELKEVDVNGNGIGPRGCVAISNALTDCGVGKLDISRNQIGSEGMKCLSRVLTRHPTTLVSLNVGYNEIGDEGGMSLVNVIEKVRLESLFLCQNKMSRNTIAAICGAVVKANTLEEISFSGHEVPMEAISDMIAKTNIREVHLRGCRLNTNDVKTLARGVKSSLTIDTLDLEYNGAITSMDYFMDEIGPHVSLKMVEVENTNLSLSDRKAVYDRLFHLHSPRANVLVALLSVRFVPRVVSSLGVLPVDTIRKLRDFLSVTS